MKHRLQRQLDWLPLWQSRTFHFEYLIWNWITSVWHYTFMSEFTSRKKMKKKEAFSDSKPHDTFFFTTSQGCCRELCMNANTNMFTDCFTLLSPCERAGVKAAKADTLGPEWKAVCGIGLCSWLLALSNWAQSAFEYENCYCLISKAKTLHEADLLKPSTQREFIMSILSADQLLSNVNLLTLRINSR